MAIMIGENFKVETDKHNIILYSKAQPADAKTLERMKKIRETKFSVKAEDDIEPEEKANKGWRIEGYFGGFRNLLKFLVELEVKNTDLVSIQVIVDKVAEVYALIDRVCPNITVSELRKAKKGEVTEDE